MAPINQNLSPGRVPLLLQGGRGIVYQAWPVTQGVPFAEGALPTGTPVRVVDAAGRPRPTQAIPLATWRPDRKSVRWLLLDFQVEHPDGGPLYLEYGATAQAPEHPSPIRVKRQQEEPFCETVLVDTGKLRMEISTRPPQEVEPGQCGVFSRAAVYDDGNWVELWREGRGPVLYMSDQHGNQYDTTTAAAQPLIEIEEEGALRTCVRIQGYHASRQGISFCPYILRLHFFAGRADLRIQHTFIFDQEPNYVELAAIGLRLPAGSGAPRGLAVAGETKPFIGSPGTRRLEYLQRTDCSYEISRNGSPVAGGGRSKGWAMSTGPDGSLLAVVKDLWQEYPGGIAADQCELDVQIWPASIGENLKFTTPFTEKAILFHGLADGDEVGFRQLLDQRPTAPLNLKSYLKGRSSKWPDRKNLQWIERMVEKYAAGRAVSYCDTGIANGAGAAKTSEIFCSFSAVPLAISEADRLADCVQDPLIAPASPDYTCATGVMGHLQPAGDPRFKIIDEGLDWILREVVVKPRRVGRLYGKMTYGNMVCSHSPGPGLAWFEHKDNNPKKALRWVDASYNNESNDQILAVWSNFARTGRREHYLLAQSFSRCVADVSFIHARPDQCRDWVGLMHYHNAHRWSGLASPSHSLLGGIMTDYYFSGNRRLLEVAREVSDRLVRLQEPAGIISCRHKVLHREFTGPLWSLLEVYQATWERKYGDLARRSLYWLLRALGEPPNYPVSLYTSGDHGDEAVIEPVRPPTGHWRELYYLYAIALRLFPSEPLRQRIMADADYALWEGMVDHYVTAEQARKLLPPGTGLWAVDDQFYWTDGHQWRCHDSCGVVALAFQLTADPLYAAYAKHRLEREWPGQLQRFKSCKGAEFFDLLKFGNTIPRLARVVAEAAERDTAALKAAERAWRSRRAELGHDIYQGVGIEPDVESFIRHHPPAELVLEGPLRAHTPRQSLGRLPTGQEEAGL